jgi:membrane fusion protein (multidrug efflux system)
MQLRSLFRRRVVVGSVLGTLVIVAVAVALVALRSANGAETAKKNGKAAKEPPPAAPVELTVVGKGDLSTWLQSTTTLEPRESAALVARRAGQVTAVLVEEGAWVRAGDVLARLDDREAALEVDKAEVAFEVASREFERGEELERQGFLTPRERDDLRLKRRQAEVELERARYELSLRRIMAPFAGRVTERHIELGENLTEGRTCFRVVDFDPLRAKLYFPERDLPSLRVGQEAEVNVLAERGRAWKARVALVNPVIDQSNGTVKVTLELPNTDGALRPGAFARVRLRTGDHRGVLLVPQRGVLSEDGEEYVYVARGDTVVRAPVRLGVRDGERAEVLAGLAAGDRVVTVGQGGLKPGTRIRPVRL